MQQMKDHAVDSSDVLDKSFKFREEKPDFDIPGIHDEACVARGMSPFYNCSVLK